MLSVCVGDGGVLARGGAPRAGGATEAGRGIGAGHARNSQRRTACGRAYQAGPSPGPRPAERDRDRASWCEKERSAGARREGDARSAGADS